MTLDSDFRVLVLRGDERAPAADVARADLILQVKPAARVSVFSAPGIEHAKVKIVYAKVKIVYAEHDR